jgi:hypothetical protein
MKSGQQPIVQNKRKKKRSKPQVCLQQRQRRQQIRPLAE